MTDDTRTFLGIPIEGDVTQGSTRVPQRPLEEFAPILQAVLDDPGVEFFGWCQYTPYFNDGDVCEFSVHGCWAISPDQFDVLSEKFDDPEDVWDGFRDDDFDMDYGDRFEEAFGKFEGQTYNHEMREYVGGQYRGPNQARYDRIRALSRALNSGAFEEVLLNAFGDHADIRVCQDKIVIDFYEHD